MLGIRDWPGWAPARRWQNIESIVFELDELLGDVFYPMPRGRPVLSSVLSDNGHAVSLDAGRRQRNSRIWYAALRLIGSMSDRDTSAGQGAATRDSRR